MKNEWYVLIDCEDYNKNYLSFADAKKFTNLYIECEDVKTIEVCNYKTKEVITVK